MQGSTTAARAGRSAGDNVVYFLRGDCTVCANHASRHAQRAGTEDVASDNVGDSENRGDDTRRDDDSPEGGAEGFLAGGFLI